MSEMVERVARAIDECLTARVKRGDPDPVFRMTTAEEVARAAIAAMREPREAMTEEAVVISSQHDRRAVRRAFPEHAIFVACAALSGHRFGKIVMLWHPELFAASLAERENGERWLHEDLELKLKPGGEMIWLV